MKLVHSSERAVLDNSKLAGYFITPNGTLNILNNTTAIATSDGLTTGLLVSAPQYVTVTSSSASNIISLPQASSLILGTIITGLVGANGFKLQVNSADATTVTLNNVTTNVKATIPANVYWDATLISPTAWVLTTITTLGAYGTAIVPA